MRILGIDPGIQITGYSVLDCADDNYEVVASGSIQTDKSKGMQGRLHEIYHDVMRLCKMYSPDAASIEEVFFFKNQK